MEACSPAGVVIHIVAPGGERMRCNRLPLESCVILDGVLAGRRSLVCQV